MVELMAMSVPVMVMVAGHVGFCDCGKKMNKSHEVKMECAW